MELEHYSDLLYELRAKVSKRVEKHGGTMIRIDGDGFLYVFGHPVTYEDSGRRATEVALDIHDAARSLFNGSSEIDLAMHTGIHSGVTYVKKGDIFSGKYDVLGQATNFASALCKAAKAHEILVDKATLGVDRHFFNTQSLGQISLQGIPKPFDVESVTGRNLGATRMAARRNRGVAALIGRDNDLTEIKRAVKTHSLLVVTAPAGLGKTRLLDEVDRQHSTAGQTVLRGFCESYFQSTDLQPFQQISGSNAVEPFFESLIASADPVLILIDDWQWCDHASQDFLSALLRSETGNLCVILASRENAPLELQEFNPIEIHLSPLNTVDAEQTIRRLIHAPAPFIVKKISRYAGGNPLFIEELCHAAQIQDPSSNQEDEAFVDRDAWLAALILARFSKLDPEVSAVARAAAVVGHIIPRALLGAIIPLSLNDDRLTTLSDKDFIYDSDTNDNLQFKHIITRDVIYRTVGLSERKQLHGRIAEYLLSDIADSVDTIPSHLPFHLARSSQPKLAMQYAIKVGDHALKTGALDRAQRNFRLALEQLIEWKETDTTNLNLSKMITQFGISCVVDPGRDQLPVLQRAASYAEKCGDRKASAMAQYYLGFVYYGLGSPRKSISFLERAESANIDDKKFAVSLSAMLGEALAAACDYHPAELHLNKAIAIKRQYLRPDVPSAAHSYALSCKAFLLADQGRFDESRTFFQDAYEALKGSDHQMLASLYSQRAAACYWEGRYDEGLVFSREALKVATRTRARYLHAMSRSLIAVGTLKLDALDKAAFEQLVETTAWLETSASRQYLSLNHGWLAREYAQRSDVVNTRRHTALALQRAREGDRLGEAMAWRAMARLSKVQPMRQTPEHCLTQARRSALLRGSRHETLKNRLCAYRLDLPEN